MRPGVLAYILLALPMRTSGIDADPKLMNDQPTSKDDLHRLRHALHAVLEAARAESLAVNKAVEDCGDSMHELHESHLHELNAIQALVGSLELFERRLELRLGL